MQRITTLIAVVAFIVAASAASVAQNRRKADHDVPPVSSRFTAGNSAKIPIELDNNIIFVRARVNGSRPLKFIFDTGASVSVVNADLIGELKLKVEGHADGTATGGTIHVGLVNGVSLSVEGAEVTNQIFATLPLDKSPCVQFDGIIGYDFINQFIVEIDYSHSVINLYSPQTYA